MRSCQVYIRGSNTRIEARGDTIRHLRDAVVTYLETAEPRLQAQAQAIRIYKNNGNESPTELNDVSPLTATVQNTYYTAFEVFTVVPTDLFRTVTLLGIHPGVDAEPGNEFSRVSPLFCAALSQSESQDPPFHMQGGRVMVRGASLTCRDFSIPATIGPTDDVEADEPHTLMRIGLDDDVFKNTYQEVQAGQALAYSTPHCFTTTAERIL
jgi:hypothetical protein